VFCCWFVILRALFISVIFCLFSVSPDDILVGMKNENLNWKNPKTIIILIVVLGIIGTVFVSLLREKIIDQSFGQVTVVGQGKVSYKPDTAIVVFDVEVVNKKSSLEALTALDTKITKINEVLKKAGVVESNVSVSNYTFSPYNEGETQGADYGGKTQVMVRILGHDKSPDILKQTISAVLTAGAKRVFSVSLDISNVEQLKQQARLLAISDAQTKAQGIAKAADVKIKNIANWYESLIQIPQPIQSYYYGGGFPNSFKEIILEITVNYNTR
jgi:uncharacterized protein YggE